MTSRRMLDREVSTSEAIVQVLIDAGIERAYGIPGGESGRIFRELERRSDQIEVIVTRQENIASAMAETTGRLTGIPGVLIGQAPWVLGFGIVGILEAQLSSSPMLVLTDYSDRSGHLMHAPYQSGSGHYGNWNAPQAFAAVCKRVVEAPTPVDAVHGTQLALKHALTGEPGPVAVLYSAAALSGTVNSDTRPRIYTTDRYIQRNAAVPGDRQLADCVKAISEAHRPVVIAGNGVRISQAESQLALLAKTLDLPVTTTPSGKGVFAEDDERALGVFGTYGTAVANAAVSEADMVIWIGSKASVSDTAFESPVLLDPERQSMIQIDIEPLNAGRSFPCDQILVGDAKETLQRINEVSDGSLHRGDGGAKWIRALKEKHGYFPRLSPEDAGGPLRPMYVIQSIQDRWSRDGIVTCDAGENRLFMLHHYQTARPGALLQAGGMGPMGYGIPAALAAKKIFPERAVAAVIGDGGFAMSINGLMTAVEFNIPIAVVILNNDGFGWSIHGGATSKRFESFDLAKTAETLGCHGIRVNEADELPHALDLAMQTSDVPTVVDVRVAMEPTFKDVQASFAIPVYPRA